MIEMNKIALYKHIINNNFLVRSISQAVYGARLLTILK